MGGSECGLTTLARARGDARRLLGITLGEDDMLPHVRTYDSLSDCLFRIVRFGHLAHGCNGSFSTQQKWQHDMNGKQIMKYLGLSFFSLAGVLAIFARGVVSFFFLRLVRENGNGQG